MKTIGILGGMSWESTVDYYKIINTIVSQSLGGLHSAKLLIASLDFDPIVCHQRVSEWEKAGEILATAAVSLERGGADFIILACNTMHKVADQIRAAIRIPFFHIADATAEAIVRAGVRCVGLLGTVYTMRDTFLRDPIAARGIEIVVPRENDQEFLQRIIFEELSLGIVREESREEMLCVIQRMRGAGVEGVVLGCTELGMLVRDGDGGLLIFDTTRIHARAAAKMALGL
jgi:aspartate racemase